MPWVSRKKVSAAQAEIDKLLKTLEDMKKRSILIGIERTGRVNKFIFVRGEQMHEIETMGLISDPLPEWKEKLLR